MLHSPSPVSPLPRTTVIRSISLAVGAVLALWGAPGRAEQFILFDATFDYTWEDAMNSSPSKSHFYVNEGNFLNKARPVNWLSPVDYRNGTLHVRAEVFLKPPGTQTTGFTLCYIPNAGGYGCADTDYYRSTGVFERDVPMTDWWNNGQPQWDRGIKQMDLIYAINDSGSGHVTNYPELKDLTTPTRVRITMVQVSAGATYDPKIIPGTGDGGVAGTGGSTGDAGTSDAAASRDSGSASGSGSGGAGGTTAQPGTGGSTPRPPTSSGGSTGTTAGTGGSAGSPTPPSPGASGPVGGGCALSALAEHDRWMFATAALALGLLARLRRRGRGRRPD